MTLLWFPTLMLVALVGVRVLGVRLGWWRAVVAAWLGLASAGLFLRALTGQARPPLLLVIGLGLLAMLAFAGIFELLSRSLPTAARQSLANPLTALRGWLARGRRATQPRGTTTGRSLRAALEQAGGVYVKLGQFLSTRPDLVSPEIAAELRLLQQQVQPVPGPLVERVFTEELGRTPQACFTQFDTSPAAAASIAQVHQAVLADGRRVAVKIQRPEVAERVRRDLDILGRLAARLERRTQWAFELRLSETVASFADFFSNDPATT